MAVGADGLVAVEFGYSATAAHPITLGPRTLAVGDRAELDMCSVLRVRDGLLRIWRDYSDG